MAPIPTEMEEVAVRRRPTTRCPGGSFAALGAVLLTSLLLWLAHRGYGVFYPVAAVLCVTALIWSQRSLAQLRRTRDLDAERLGDLEALVEASALLQCETRKDAVPDLIARLATAVLKGSGASVHIVDGEGTLLRAGVHVGGTHLIEPGSEAVAAVLREGRVSAGGEDGRPLLLVPLEGLTGTHGVVALSGSEGSTIDPYRTNLARLFGSHAGLALERLRVIDSLTQATIRDPLTGVGNRLHASALLDSVRDGDAVLLIDLDRFKRVNDSDGHAAGDLVLVALGRYLRDSLREDDTVARYGGEEFLVVLRGAGESARHAAERLCAGWRAARPRTTFSVGYAVHASDGCPEITFARADMALYAAKRAGRDRVCGYEEDVSSGVELSAGPGAPALIQRARPA